MSRRRDSHLSNLNFLLELDDLQLESMLLLVPSIDVHLSGTLLSDEHEEIGENPETHSVGLDGCQSLYVGCKPRRDAEDIDGISPGSFLRRDAA